MSTQSGFWPKIAGIVILTIIVSWVTVRLSVPSATVSANNQVYDRVFNGGTIRACYFDYPPYSIKDPNTGKLSGVFVDILNKAADNMGLKVDWNAEVGWGELIEALNSDRCDVVASGVWSNSTRGKSAEFTVPVYYTPINAYARTDDHRFDGGVSIANDKKYKIATIDGETAQVVAASRFPNAQTLQLPQLTDISQMLLNVVDGKADISFVEPIVANAFLKNNPGKIKNITPAKPLVAYGNVMLVKKGEFKLKSSLDNALNELLDNGYVDGVLDGYEEEYPGGVYRVAQPYVVPQPK